MDTGVDITNVSKATRELVKAGFLEEQATRSKTKQFGLLVRDNLNPGTVAIWSRGGGETTTLTVVKWPPVTREREQGKLTRSKSPSASRTKNQPTQPERKGHSGRNLAGLSFEEKYRVPAGGNRNDS